MKIMPSLAALVTATSIGIATGHAWSDETTPGGSAVPAVQTPAPATYPAPNRYRTLPRQTAQGVPYGIHLTRGITNDRAE